MNKVNTLTFRFGSSAAEEEHRLFPVLDLESIIKAIFREDMGDAETIFANYCKSFEI